MAINSINNIAGGSITALKASANAITATAQKTVISSFSTTSVTGKVTTVTTYSDGSSQTTISEGDTVILTSKKYG